MTKHITREHAAFLAVKIKSLAAEAVIIRAAERKHARSESRLRRAHAAIAADKALADKASALARAADAHGRTMCGLHLHRRDVVRAEARAAQLAYGFLRGTPYRAIERTTLSEPDVDAVSRNVTRFGSGRDRAANAAALEAWFAGTAEVALAEAA